MAPLGSRRHSTLSLSTIVFCSLGASSFACIEGKAPRALFVGCPVRWLGRQNNVLNASLPGRRGSARCGWEACLATGHTARHVGAFTLFDKPDSTSFEGAPGWPNKAGRRAAVGPFAHLVLEKPRVHLERHQTQPVGQHLRQRHLHTRCRHPTVPLPAAGCPNHSWAHAVQQRGRRHGPPSCGQVPAVHARGGALLHCHPTRFMLAPTQGFGSTPQLASSWMTDVLFTMYTCSIAMVGVSLIMMRRSELATCDERGGGQMILRRDLYRFI